MATVYKIKIKTVSAWVNYNEDYIKKMFENFMKEYKDEFTQHKFESTEIEVEKVA